MKKLCVLAFAVILAVALSGAQGKRFITGTSIVAVPAARDDAPRRLTSGIRDTRSASSTSAGGWISG